MANFNINALPSSAVAYGNEYVKRFKGIRKIMSSNSSGKVNYGSIRFANMSPVSSRWTPAISARHIARKSMGLAPFAKWFTRGGGMTRFMSNPMGMALGFGGALALSGAWNMSKSIMSSVRWKTTSESIQQGAGYGPGYIAWSKKSGVPFNHLGTDNLTDSLHRMRHTSVI